MTDNLATIATLTVPFAQSLFTSKAGLTGFTLLVVFSIMVVTTLGPIRKSGYFEVFYLAHLGYFLWFILLLLHGPQFWKWFLVGGIGFGVERVLRSLRSKEPTYAITALYCPLKC